MEYVLHIPVTAFQRSILVRQLGEQWRLKTGHWLGQVLIGYMSPSKYMPKPAPKSGLFYPVAIPLAFVNRSGLKRIDESGVRNFINTVEEQWRKELFAFIDSRLLIRAEIEPGHIHDYGLTIKDAIIDFCAEFHLSEEDIAFETLRKAYYRKRKWSEDGLVLTKEFYSSKMSRQ